MTPAEWEYQTELLRIAAKRFLPAGALDDPARRAAALQLLRDGYHLLSPKLRRLLRQAADLPDGRSPPRMVKEFERVIGTAALHRWAERHEPAGLARLGDAGTLAHWMADPPTTEQKDLRAGLRTALGIGTEKDHKLVAARLGPLLRRGAMPDPDIDFYEFDPRGVPPVFDEKAFEGFVAGVLKETLPKDAKPSMTSFALGAMSLDGFLAQDEVSQRRHLRDIRFESENTTKKLDGTPLLNREAYDLISKEIRSIRTPLNGHTPTPRRAYYEELTFVARALISNAVVAPIDARGLRDRVAASLAEYAPGLSGGTLNLPSLDAPEGVDTDLVPENIRAVALVYAAWNLEEMKLFQVLDRVVEVFMNGQLPVGFDNGGRALADYYFDDDEQRLTEAARRMTYSRVLGAPGGEVSKEAPPNRGFQDLFLRFMASVSEYDRQRRIADVVGTRPRTDVLSLTGEQVRKAGRDLAANASLYGYGGTFFVAQRLSRQIERAIRILSVPEILSAYGVQGPLQVIERVAASDFGGNVPNIFRLRTMADAGKGILDIVAGNVPAWLGRSGQDLFVDPFASDHGGADIPPTVERQLMRNTEHWLAVNGIKDEQRARLGEPEVTAPAPTIPTTGRDGAGAAFDQLRQMVSAGQMPSMDQLKSMLPVGGIGM